MIHRWVPSERHVGGGPDTVFGPGFLTQHGALLEESDDRLFFASSEISRKLAVALRRGLTANGVQGRVP